MERSAEDIVRTLHSSFSDTNVKPTPEQVEVVMRALAPESFQLRTQIQDLLRGAHLYFPVDAWMEANMVVSGSGRDHQRAVRFLLMDTCTCVLDHLQKAIEHASGPIDPRILALKNHEYFQKK